MTNYLYRMNYLFVLATTVIIPYYIEFNGNGLVMASMKINCTNDTPLGRVAYGSLPCLFTGVIGLLDPHRQLDSSHPHEVCLIMGDGGNGAVSGFVLHPLGGPGSPYFQSSYPCLIVGAVS